MPVFKCVLDKLLFLLCKLCGFYIEYTDFISVRLGFGVIDTHITEVKGIFKYLICVGSVCSVGGIGGNIVIDHRVFVGYALLGGKIGIVDLDTALVSVWGVKEFIHKFLHILFVYENKFTATFKSGTSVDVDR